VKGAPLYYRLSKYAPTPGRTQVENFLTESLCDLLERMTVLDRRNVESFISDILVGSEPPSTASIFRDKLTSAGQLEWETQHRIELDAECGYLDLCLFADNRIVLVIENKIASGFTSHGIPGEDGQAEVKFEDQLHFYDRWLSAKWPGAGLVLLTQFTDAPSDFLDEKNRQITATNPIFHRVCRWATVYERIGRWRESYADQFKDEPDGMFLSMLCAEFRQFLERMKMNPTEMKDDDLGLLTAYCSQDIWKKVRDLMASVRARVLPLLPSSYSPSKRVPATEAWQETQIMWDWAYCYEKKLKWYIGWGLSGANGLRHLDIELPSPLQAFVLIGSDNRRTEPAITSKEVIDGWATTKRQLALIKVVAAQVLAGSSKGFNRALEEWVEVTVKEGVGMLEKAREVMRRSDAASPTT
jgi:hypothetical protein